VTRNIWICLAVALLVLAVDQGGKAWVMEGLRLQEGQSLRLSSLFAVTLTRNYSMSFGLLGTGPTARMFLLIFPVVVVGFLANWARKSTSPLLSVALGFVIGGALGNAIDRFRYGWVVDFLDFSALKFPWIGNPADWAIGIGVALLALHLFRNPERGGEDAGAR
jgi:signal peptidase II